MSRFYTSVIRRGDNILVREIRGGIRNQFKHKLVPKLYIPSQNGRADMHDMHGKPLIQVPALEKIKDATDFIEQYKHVDNVSVYGNINWAAQYIADEYSGEISFDPERIRTQNFDIEVASDEGFPEPEDANYPVISITLFDSMTNQYYVWACGDWENKRNDDVHINYRRCKDESSLLSHFVDFISTNTPDVFTGWNIKTFDIPYLVNRIKKLFGEKFTQQLSPWGIISEKNGRNKFGQPEQTYDIVGISILDYLDLYQKYTYQMQESYTLDHIAYVELGERKLDYSEAGTLHTLYLTDFQKFIDYNIRDVELVKGIDEKMKLLDLVFTLAYMTKQHYNDTFSPVKTWETNIYNYYREHGIVAKVKDVSNNVHSDIAGGYVKEPKKGRSKWIVSVDLNSLYPHLIMQYNIGPDSLVENPTAAMRAITSQVRDIEQLVQKQIDLSTIPDGYGMAANCAFYSNDHKSVLSVQMEALYADRKVAKKKMLGIIQDKESVTDLAVKREMEKQIAALDNMQMAYKILMNSGYGAIANKYFQFFDPVVAESITLSGQLSIRWIARKINEYLNNVLKTDDYDYIVAIDTDSNYIELNKLVEAVFGDPDSVESEKIVNFLDKAMKEQIEPYIAKSYAELAEYMHAYQNKMVMEREAIASSAVWTGKKRYAMMVHDNEGVRYAKPKMKVVGLEIKKSSTPEYCRNALSDAVEIVLTGTEKQVQKYIADTRKNFKKLKPEDIAFPRSVNNIDKWSSGDESLYISRTPKHVKAAIIFNSLVKKHDNVHEQPIQNGEKIKFIDLKEPNFLHQAVVGWPSHSYLPPEFGLHKYVDYDHMFNKTFLDPLTSILDAVEWKPEAVISLTDFFG